MRSDRLALSVILLLFFGTSACSEKATTEPEPYPFLYGVVSDAEGRAAGGASVTLSFGIDGADLPGWEDPAKRAETTLRFFLGEPARAHLWIEDYVGEHVRTMVDDELEAGEHSVTWLGTDEEGARVPPGVYYIKFQYWQNGPESPPFEQTKPMILYEFEPQALIGMPHAVTDAEGRFEIPLALFPIGEEFMTTDSGGRELGMKPISDRVHVFALIENGDGIEFVDRYVRVTNRENPISVDLQLP